MIYSAYNRLILLCMQDILDAEGYMHNSICMQNEKIEKMDVKIEKSSKNRLSRVIGFEEFTAAVIC